MEGNTRFTNGTISINGLLSYTKLKELAEKGQKPFAIVLTCSDSRSPAELVFDQGVGDLFVIRVAGNVVAPSLLASIEFAAANFGSPIILVLGHTQCGAISATVNHVQHPDQALPSPHLEELVGRIRPAVESMMNKATESEIISASTAANVHRSMKLISEQSAIVQNLVQAGKTAIRGGILNISTGKVELLN